MKKFIKKPNPRFRSIIRKYPKTEREIAFTELWQQKKYQEALETTFPDQWVWFAEDINNEIITDYPTIAGSGEALSERAFAVINKAFPLETKLNHAFEIDGHKFFWFSPPVVDKDAFNETKLNVFMLKPRYTTVWSEKFVNIWIKYGFTGADFVEINTI